MPDTDVGQINFYSMHHDKCKSAYNIYLVNLFNLFPLKIVQKCQNYQPYVLWENSNKNMQQVTSDIDPPVYFQTFKKMPSVLLSQKYFFFVSRCSTKGDRGLGIKM